MGVAQATSAALKAVALAPIVAQQATEELKLKLSKPMFIGTPTNIKRANLEPVTGKSRGPFMVPAGTKLLLLKRPVTSSDAAPVIGELDTVNDGEKEGGDGYFIELGPGKQWIQIDLGAPYALHAILASIEDWARPRAMTKVVGPYGFSDQDPEGYLIEGGRPGRPIRGASLVGQAQRVLREIDTPYETVFFPKTVEDYKNTLEAFLRDARVAANPVHAQQARRFLYYQLYRTSLPFDSYLENTETKGYVRLKNFDLKSLRPENAPALATILEGVLHDGDLLLKE